MMNGKSILKSKYVKESKRSLNTSKEKTFLKVSIYHLRSYPSKIHLKAKDHSPYPFQKRI